MPKLKKYTIIPNDDENKEISRGIALDEFCYLLVRWNIGFSYYHDRLIKKIFGKKG